MKRFLMFLWGITFPVITLLAEREDHGRLYALDDEVSSSHSPAFYIISFIIGAICVFFLCVSTLKSKGHNTQDKGCIIIFLIGLLVIAALCLPNLL